jgi:phage-related protein
VGEFAVPWTATLIGPVVNPRLENISTGETLYFEGELGVGDELTVDSLNRSIVLNGNASRYSWLAVGSQWFSLAPGETSIRYAGSTVGAGARYAIAFESAWIQ